MNLSPRHLIRLLESLGFIHKRSKGSHALYYNSDSKITVVVPVHEGRDMRKGTLLTILKQAGIDRKTFETFR